MKFLKTLFLTLSLPFQSFGVASYYYIDYVAGDDTNLGTLAAPFKHCPGDPNATGNANRISVAGDTNVFKGGVIYAFGAGTTDCIQINASGTSINPITFMSGHLLNTPWGSGYAKIDGANSEIIYNSRMGIFSMISRSWIVIDGFEIYNNPDREDYTGMIGWRGTGGNIVIKRNFLHDGGGSGILLHGLTGAGSNPANFYLDGNTISNFNAHTIFGRAGLDNITVTNNALSWGGVQVYSGSFAGDGIFLGVVSGDNQNGLVVANNDFGSFPIKGHIIFAANSTTNRIYGNYFHGTNNVFSIATTRNITNTWIYNNIFDCKIQSFEGIIRFLTDEGTTAGGHAIDWRFLSNTLNTRPAAGGVIYFGKGNSVSNQLFFNITIKDNIINDTVNTYPLIYVQANNAASGPIVDIATFSSDYNTFNSTLASPFVWNNVSLSFANWRSTTGGDLNSRTNNVSYVSVLTQDYHLASSDIGAKGYGTTLSEFSIDKDRLTRSVPWDIGAYKYVAPGVKAINYGTIQSNSTLR